MNAEEIAEVEKAAQDLGAVCYKHLVHAFVEGLELEDGQEWQFKNDNDNRLVFKFEGVHIIIKVEASHELVEGEKE